MRFIISLVCISAVFTLAPFRASTPFAAATDGGNLATFAPDCETPKTVFVVGDSVCAVAAGAPTGPPAQRRFEWVAPDGTIFQLGPDIIVDPQANSMVIPKSGLFAQVGTWTVKTVDSSNNGFSAARFVVHDPGSSACDLSVSMFGSAQVPAGSHTTFNLVVTNSGPNDAQNIVLIVTAATNSVGTSAEQTAGPIFRRADQAPGGAGATAYTIADLPANTTASFVFVHQLEDGLPSGASVSSTATVSSSTRELYSSDNVATATTTIIPQPCNISCPSSIVTSKIAGQCGAVIDYSAPVASGSNCGALSCSPASGSFFPIGTSNVICFGKTGSPCSFTVTVADPSPPYLTCSPDISASESSPGMGLAIVSYKPPTTGGDCAADASACTPPPGSSFPLGTTTVRCEVSNLAGQGATCSFNVTVERNNCTPEFPANIIRSNKPGECGAAVTYRTPSLSGSCGAVSCAPPSDSFFPIGVTIVLCISETGSSSSFAVTIQDTQGPIITKASTNPSTLVPANGKMREVEIGYLTRDNCSGDVTCALDVSSNEPEQKDGPPDWEIVDAHHLRLRAIRRGKTNARLYTITITCTDSGGNASSENVTVAVPRGQR